MSDAQYRRILHSTFIVGGSSALKILVGLTRIKALAMILGPAGVGLAGLLDSIMRTASTVTGLGMGTSGVRQLAVAGEDLHALTRVRRALFIGNILLGILGGTLLWLFSAPIAQYAFGDAAQARNVAWLGLGVFLTLIATSQTALLQGLRRVGDMAKASVLGALAGTIVGVLVIWHWGQAGIIVFILIAPASAVVAGTCYTSRLPHVGKTRTSFIELAPQWREMATLGFAFMLTALLTEGTQLYVRSMIGRELSLEAVGRFQAAWTISMQYIGFVLAAMAVDYYPHLASTIKDTERSNRMVNEQVQASLLLGGPVMLGMLAMAPWVIEILYSADFRDSVSILRWQVLGDIIKVASWPVGFILIARAERSWFLLTQCVWNFGYGLLVLVGLPFLGLEITGVAFFSSYLAGFVINSLITYRLTGFNYTSTNLKLLASLLMGAFIIVVASCTGNLYGLVVGLILTLAFTRYSISRLLLLSNSSFVLPRALKRMALLFRLRRP